VVASNAVVPCSACRRATCKAASPPSMTSRPAPPCTCRSMKPGSSSGSGRSRACSAVIASPSMAAMRPCASIWRVPATKPAGVRMLPASVRVTGPLPWFRPHGLARQRQRAGNGVVLRRHQAAAQRGPHARRQPFGDAAARGQWQAAARIDCQRQVFQRRDRALQQHQPPPGPVLRCRRRRVPVARIHTGRHRRTRSASCHARRRSASRRGAPKRPHWRGHRARPALAARLAGPARPRCLRHPQENPIRRL
jgi:hypothetical protein